MTKTESADAQAVGAVLASLIRDQRELHLTLPGVGALHARVLNVDMAARRFVMECVDAVQALATLPGDSHLLAGEASAVIDDVALTFAIDVPRNAADTFAADFPTGFRMEQRRAHFRVDTTDYAYVAEARTVGGNTVRLRIADLSASGVGLCSDETSPDLLPVGTLLSDATLHFGTLASMETALRVVRYQASEGPDGIHYHFGCEFVGTQARVLG